MSISRSLIRRLDEASNKASNKNTGKGSGMRFLVMVKGNADSNFLKEYEAGAMPKREELLEMDKFNDELVKAGVMLAGEGLQPSSKGARIRYTGAKPTVRDGPFTESKELVAGFWIWQVKSRAEALEWAK